MDERSPQQKFEVLCDISRAQHFAWREAVVREFSSSDAAKVVMRMWRITGEQTARSYLKRIDPNRPLAAQIGAGIVWSSDSMGEEAACEPGSGPEEVFVRHRRCPWQKWHERNGLLAEDRPGCDEWFRATCETVSAATGRTLRFETLDSLPEGGSSCLRRLWVER